MSDIDALVVAHALGQHGVISRSEAKALGMSDRTLKRRVAEGLLIRISDGVVGLPGVFHDEETALRAASSAIGAVASHESASRLLGLSGLDLNRWPLSLPIRRSNRFGDLTVHQLTDLDASQTREIRGIPVTDPVRTVIDLSAVLPIRRLSDIVDQSVRKRLATYRGIGLGLEHLARRGKPGVVKLRKVLEARSSIQITPESTLETIVLDTLMNGGLPPPSTQFKAPWLRRVDGRVDLAYVEVKLVIEADSRRWHESPEAFQADRQRDNAAQLAGWTILRFTWEDITKRPQYVVNTVEQVLARSVSVRGHIWPAVPKES